MTPDLLALQDKWDRTYAATEIAADRPPRILQECAHQLPKHGKALDVACGLGAGAIFLARRGLHVTAWDLSPVAVEKVTHYAQRHDLPIEAEVVDLAQAQLPTETFDVIHVTRFLLRSLCPDLVRALRPGGLLCYQTYSLEALDSTPHKNPAYCLMRGELLELFHELRPVYYREDVRLGDASQGLQNEVLLVAQKRTPRPRVYEEWVRKVTGGDDPAALSRAIDKYRPRVSVLPDRWAPLVAGDSTTRANEWGLLENEEFLVLPDSSAPGFQALVVVKGRCQLPTDLPEEAMNRLGGLATALAGALCKVTGAPGCRTWVSHPDDLESSRLHLIVEPELTVTDPEAKRAIWGKVVPLIPWSNEGAVA